MAKHESQSKGRVRESAPHYHSGEPMPAPPGATAETAVFRSGNSDAVRIPRKFGFPKGRVVMRMLPDGALLIVPKRKRAWPRRFFASLPAVTDDFRVPVREGTSREEEARAAGIFDDQDD